MPVKFVRTAIAALVRRLDAGRPARMPRQFRMQWNSGRLSRALKIPEEQILGYFRDGAHAPFLVGGRLVQEHPGWGPGAGPGRLVAPDGGAWEVRCLTEGGVSLAGDTHRNPGGESGKSSRPGGLILADIVNFPTVEIFVLPAENLQRWRETGQLPAAGKIGRTTFRARLVRDIRVDSPEFS